MKPQSYLNSFVVLHRFLDNVVYILISNILYSIFLMWNTVFLALNMSVSGLPSKFVNANMFVCIILGNVGPGESISWMDATLQEMKVSGQCGAVPRSCAFQSEALCKVHHAIAQINIY